MKTIWVKVQPNAKMNSVVESKVHSIDLEVKTTAPATDNLANLAIIKLISKHLQIRPSKVILLKGGTTKIKQIGILKT